MSNTHTDTAAGFSRITLKAYARDHEVELVSRGRAMRAELIDISQGGARLLADVHTVAGLHLGQPAELNILLDGGHLQSGPAPCVVTWARGHEVEVEFPAALDLGLAELQHMVDHAPRAGALRMAV